MNEAQKRDLDAFIAYTKADVYTRDTDSNQPIPTLLEVGSLDLSCKWATTNRETMAPDEDWGTSADI
jgi:hypothetical protein